MNYTNHHAVFTNKFKSYSAEQCAYANIAHCLLHRQLRIRHSRF